MDGFAAGMSVAGFGVLGALLWSSGHDSAGAAALVIGGAALGFLRHNFPPATIFLGDVGSAPLGYLAAALALQGDRRGAIPLWASLLVFSPFVVDATATLLRRAFRGEKVWQAHRTHAYQRLVQAGWSHRRTVLWEYVLMIACGASAVLAIRESPHVQQLTLVAWAGLYTALILAVAWRARAARRDG
jgi:UDP-N-acetylmuramyl pentapeptide phosphotransferase/UDP-N-acetylglucosamine-1-phosphate transferase